MKIINVKSYPLRCVLDEGEVFGWAQTWVRSRVTTLIEIATDEGVSGWGESFCFYPEPISSIVDHVYKPILLGKDPLDISPLWERMYNSTRSQGQKGMVICALSGVDVALWDLAGKALGLPVYRLLGGQFRDKVQAYATGLYFKRCKKPAEALVEEAKGYLREGFKAMKMKVGLTPKVDIEHVKAVREAIGYTLLMVDANCAYDASTAIALGRELENLDIYWFEEPVPPEDLEGYAKVRATLDIPIAGGECEFTRFGFREIFLHRALDVAQPDICAAGGLTESRRIAEMAEAFGVRCIPHVWGTQIAIAAALQFLASLPRPTPSMNPIEPLLELDRTPNPIRDAVVREPIEPKEGFMAIPNKPGLGVEVER
ncbi:MAG: mandelate racemase/muconate lactonizing enzyme family protein, partial [Nitrososphaerota archaeon]